MYVLMMNSLYPLFFHGWHFCPQDLRLSQVKCMPTDCINDEFLTFSSFTLILELTFLPAFPTLSPLSQLQGYRVDIKNVALCLNERKTVINCLLCEYLKWWISDFVYMIDSGYKKLSVVSEIELCTERCKPK